MKINFGWTVYTLCEMKLYSEAESTSSALAGMGTLTEYIQNAPNRIYVFQFFPGSYTRVVIGIEIAQW